MSFSTLILVATAIPFSSEKTTQTYKHNKIMQYAFNRIRITAKVQTSLQMTYTLQVLTE